MLVEYHSVTEVLENKVAEVMMISQNIIPHSQTYIRGDRVPFGYRLSTRLIFPLCEESAVGFHSQMAKNQEPRLCLSVIRAPLT
jgi:hypothetical protein